MYTFTPNESDLDKAENVSPLTLVACDRFNSNGDLNGFLNENINKALKKEWNTYVKPLCGISGGKLKAWNLMPNQLHDVGFAIKYVLRHNKEKYEESDITKALDAVIAASK